MKSSKLAPGQDEVLIPGELEHRNTQKFRKEGIPVIPQVVEEIKEIADYFGMSQMFVSRLEKKLVWKLKNKYSFAL